MVQIDGGVAPATCAVQCAYTMGNPVSIPGNGGTFSVTAYRTSGSCDWLALTDSPWITINRPFTGSDRSSVSYTVAANTGAPRSGRIQLTYPGGPSYLDINQGAPSYNLAFQFFDPATSTAPATECLIKTTATICTLNAVTATLPASMASFDWKVEYAYGGTKVRTQVGPLPTFSFTESCGVSAAEGSPVAVQVTLKATDTAGNTATIYSGQGTQPPLQLRTFNCP
jgi:hypothetical protein